MQEYGYSTDEPDFDLRHKLIRHKGVTGSGETAFAYNEGELTVTDSPIDYLVPFSYATRVTDPEGGETAFDFGQFNDTDTTIVTDGRGHDTRYTMNEYGSVLEIDDPVGKTTMTWSPEDVTDVLMESRKDANGVLTEYEYDEDGNVIEEVVTDALRITRYTITRTYKDFPGKPWIKNRVETETDRNGHLTQYFYDDNGNLEKVIDAEDNVTEYGYNNLGDRILMIDPRGNPTTYRYDPEDYGT